MGRILAVDDDALARAVVLDALTGLGHEATVVGSGLEALRLIAGGGFDLLITDLVMPEMDGLELARRVAALPRPVPVLLVSGARRPTHRGTDTIGFLPKPLDADRLGRFLDVFYRRPRGASPPAATGEERWEGLDFLGQIDGPLERFPPVRVLFLAHRVGASGALHVEQKGLTALIGLRSGRVMHATGVPGLFSALVPPIPDRKDLSSDLAAAVAAGHAPDRALYAAAEGLGAFLADLVDARGGKVLFDPSWQPPGGAFPLPEAIPRLIAMGLVRARSDARIARSWRALESAAVRRRIPTDAPDDRWGLDATCMRVFRLVPRVKTVEALVHESVGTDPARRPEVMRAMDALNVLGLLVVDGGESSPASAASDDARDATQEDPRAERLTRALEAMQEAHPLVVLELGERIRVSEEDVANAYREISRRYHPDTFFSATPAIRGVAEACFARVNTAYEALRAPGGLSEAKRFLEARAQGVAFVSEKDHVAARVAFRRADSFVRARDWKAADPLLQDAVRLDCLAWPHAITAAWVGWLATRLSAAQAIEAIEEIRPIEPAKKAEVQVYIGNILKQEGQAEKALARFRMALQFQPDNRDALREVRLHDVRNPGKAK